MNRLEDKGLTLRLFVTAREVGHHLQTCTVYRYEFGYLGRTEKGQWIDAHGTLPSSWEPTASKLTKVPASA